MTAERHLDPDTVARLSLLSLGQMGPARLIWLLGEGDAPAALEALRRGRFPDGLGQPPPGVFRTRIERWRHELTDVDARVERILAANRKHGVTIISPVDAAWPFADDPEPPGLLFAKGDPELLSAPTRVAIVGTRRCTSLGRHLAYGLGCDLARAEATVVSGLALGVDGAGHQGALDVGGAVIGVVASGLDVVYPRANQTLWDEVADRGVLVSETPTGSRPDRWRFPARNRLIAGLSDAVVVVESHERGGALSTAEEAVRRDRPVMAVPGSVRSSASRGTNALLVDGAVPIRDVVDILAYLGRPVPAALLAGPPVPTPPPVVDGGPDDAHLSSTVGDPSAGPASSSTIGDPPAGPAAEEWVDRSGPSSSPTPDGGSSSAADAEQWGGDEPPVARRGPLPAPPPGSIQALILGEVAAGPVHLDDLVAVLAISVADALGAVQELQAAGLVELDGSTVAHPGARS